MNRLRKGEKDQKVIKLLIEEKIYCSLIHSAWSFSPSQAPFRALCSNALLVILTLLVFPVNRWDHQSQIWTARWICFLFIRIHWRVSRSVMPDSLWHHELQPSRLLWLGIFQTRILEWVAISFSRGSSWPKVISSISCVGRWILYSWATSVTKLRLKPNSDLKALTK